MGGGTGKGTTPVSSGQAETVFSQQLGATIGEAREMSRPVRAETYAQTLEALKTGGVGAQIPTITRAVEASRRAGSQALTQTDAYLAAAGLGRTPFGARERGRVGQESAYATSQIPSQYAAQIAGYGVPLTQSSEAIATQGASSGLGSSAGASAARYGSTKGFWTGMGSTMGGLKCWIAATLYGPSPAFAAAFYWINFGWQGRLANATRRFYGRFGQRIARHPWLCLFLKPLFDLAVRRGMEALDA